MNVSRVHRLLRLITLLQTGRNYSAADLARELEVCKRTVYRDLNMLELAHIPYYFDPDTGGYRIGGHFFLPPINLTLAEALSMLAMTGRIEGAHNVPLLGHGARAAVKLEGALPHGIRGYVGSVLGKMRVSLGPLADHDGLDSTFDTLGRAVVDRRICMLSYNSLHDKKTIHLAVKPLKLLFMGRAWYLIAYSKTHRENRTFKLSRIEKIVVTPKVFTKPREVDLDKYFGNAWSMIPEGREYRVHLRFTPKVATNVSEVRWHRTQETQLRPDGSLDYRAKVDGLGEITWWILGYGDQVEVIAPASLRKSVIRVAKSVLSNYGSPVEELS
ncbi:MAG: WYL domain-containing protein [Phycisphaerae bacterium]|nr:WYL domain-containing protein [Phycisphaerae bacterium]